MSFPLNLTGKFLIEAFHLLALLNVNFLPVKALPSA